MEQKLFARVDQYIEQVSCGEDENLRRISRSIQESGIPDASVSPNQGKYLEILARTAGSRRILELGTLGGYSTVWLARSLPSDGKLITIEFDPKHAQLARSNFALAGLDHIIELREGRALDILREMIRNEETHFDFVFIDADKPPYKEYFQLVIQMCRKGAMIICDNVIRNGQVLDPACDDEKVKGVQRLNEWLMECKEVAATIVQNVGVKEHDGMVVAVVI
ncbi:MAG: O-methyltransferase [Flavobacteriales bacterium]